MTPYLSPANRRSRPSYYLAAGLPTSDGVAASPRVASPTGTVTEQDSPVYSQALASDPWPLSWRGSAVAPLRLSGGRGHLTKRRGCKTGAARAGVCVGGGADPRGSGGPASPASLFLRKSYWCRDWRLETYCKIAEGQREMERDRSLVFLSVLECVLSR